MEHMMGKALKLREDLTLVAIENEAALLDVDKRCYFQLNSTGYFLVQLMEDGHLYEDIKAALVSEFDVDDETSRVDVDSFVEEVLSLGLANIVEAVAQDIVRKPKVERKPYQAPRLERQADLVLVAGKLLGIKSPE